MFDFSLNLECVLYTVVKSIGNFLSITMLLKSKIVQILSINFLKRKPILLGLKLLLILHIRIDFRFHVPS